MYVEEGRVHFIFQCVCEAENVQLASFSRLKKHI